MFKMTFIKVCLAEYTEFSAEEAKRIKNRIKEVMAQEFTLKVSMVYVPLSKEEKSKL